MCVFCESKVYLLNFRDCVSEIEDKEIIIRTYKNDIAERVFSFEINFCPKCGEKLVNNE